MIFVSSRCVSVENFPTLIRLADKFLALELKQKCLRFLKTFTLPLDCNQEKCLEFLCLCDKYNTPEGVKICMPTVAQLPVEKIREYKDEMYVGIYACLVDFKVKLSQNKFLFANVDSITVEGLPCFYCNGILTRNQGGCYYSCCKLIVCGICKHRCEVGKSYMCWTCNIVCYVNGTNCRCEALKPGAFEYGFLNR